MEEEKAFLHSALRTEGGELIEEDLPIVLSTFIGETKEGMIRLALSEREVVFIRPEDLKRKLSTQHEEGNLLGFDDRQVTNLLKMGSIFQLRTGLSGKEKEDLAIELQSGFSETLLKDPEFVLKALKLDERIFPRLSPEITDEKTFIERAYRENPKILRFVDDRLANTPAFIQFITENFREDGVDCAQFSSSIIGSRWFYELVLQEPDQKKVLNLFMTINSYFETSMDLATRVFIERPEILKSVTNTEIKDTFCANAIKLAISHLSKEVYDRSLSEELGDLEVDFYRFLSADLKNDRTFLSAILEHVPSAILQMVKDPTMDRIGLKQFAVSFILEFPDKAPYFEKIPNFDLAAVIAAKTDLTIDQLNFFSRIFPSLAFFLPPEKISGVILANARNALYVDYKTAIPVEYEPLLEKYYIENVKKSEESKEKFETKEDRSILKVALAQVAGIGGTSEGVKLEGDLEMFYEMLIADLIPTVFPPETSSTYSEPFIRASRGLEKEREFIEDYQRGKPIIINAGFLSDTLSHPALIVLQGEHLLICNRGARAYGVPAICYTKIDPAQVTEDLIKLMIMSIGVKSLEAQNLFLYEVFPNLLAKEPRDYDRKDLVEGHLVTKSQKVGNCSCASPKAAFKAVAFLHHFETSSIESMEERVKFAAEKANLDAKRLSIALRKKVEAQIKEDPGSRSIYQISRIKTIKMELKYLVKTPEDVERITEDFYELIRSGDPKEIEALEEFPKMITLLIQKRNELSEDFISIGKPIEERLAYKIVTWQLELNHDLEADLSAERRIDVIYNEVEELTRGLSLDQLERVPSWNEFIRNVILRLRFQESAAKLTSGFTRLYKSSAARAFLFELIYAEQTFEKIEELFQKINQFLVRNRFYKADVEANPQLTLLIERIIDKRQQFENAIKESEDLQLVYRASLVQTLLFSLNYQDLDLDKLNERFATLVNLSASLTPIEKRAIPNYLELLRLLKEEYERIGQSDENLDRINQEIRIISS
jgi:hypothetical protein